jgi:uncharacterized membrane protein
LAFLAAFIFGLIAGARSMLAPALVSWGASLGYINVQSTPMAFMGNHYARWIFTVLAIGELIADKLPMTPSRKAPGPFIARIVTGALSGATVGAAAHSLGLGVLLGVVGAVAGTLGGAAVRKRLAALLGRDFPAALIEDTVVLAAGICALLILKIN